MNPKLLSSILAALLVGHSFGAEAPPQCRNLRGILTKPTIRWDQDTLVYLPDDPGFSWATQRWNDAHPPTFSASISPASEDDVGKAIHLANTLGIPFLATGGRHGGSTSLAGLQDGLSINLRKMNSVEVDKSAATLTIGGGTLSGEVVDPVFDAGYMLPLGSCSCTGVVGVTLGAGVGRFQGTNGLLVDSLLSARVVTADGEVHDVSADSNPDLFWALRGAGANFGIVTSATYRLYPLQNDGIYTNFDVYLAPDQYVDYFNALGSVASGNDGILPPELAVASVVVFDPKINNTAIMASWTYAGPEEKAREVMAPLFAMKPHIVIPQQLQWNHVSSTAGFGFDEPNCVPGRELNQYGANMRNVSAPTYISAFEKMRKLHAERPERRQSVFIIESFSSHAEDLLPDDTMAYHWKDANSFLLLILDSKDDDAYRFGRELRADFASTSGYPDLRVLVNYAHGDETLEQMYGADKLPRLQELKGRWDPTNAFGFQNPLVRTDY